MPRATSAVLLLLAAGATSALRAPSAHARPLARSALARAPPGIARLARSKRVAVAAFGGGDDKFFEASLSADSFGAKLGTPLGKVALQGVVAIAAVAGWGIAPSVRPVVKGIFAAAGAAGGFAARRKLVAMRREAASGVLAKLLSQKGVSNVGRAEAWELAQAYGVSEEDFSAQLGSLLGTYLEACIRYPQPKTAELSDLLSLRRTFQLGFDVTGDAVFDVASRFYSEARAYFQAEEEHEAKLKLDKLVFLADRLLSEDPSEEGFRYERLRICKKFGLDDKDWTRRVERIAAPFFRDLLGTVAKDPAAVNERDLAAVGKQLGLADATAGTMKVEELRRVVGAAIDASGGKFTGSQLEKIKAMVKSLGLSEQQYREVVEAAVSPAFSAALADAMLELESGADDSPARLIGKLAVRQQELDMSTETASTLELAAARQRAGKLVQGALMHLRAQNTQSTYEQLQKLVRFGKRLAQMAKASGKADVDVPDGEVMATILEPDKVRGCSEAEASQLFRVFALECLQGARLADEDSERLADLRAVLGVSEAESRRAFEQSATPLYMAKLNDGTAAPLTTFAPGLAAELAELATRLGLSADAAKLARVSAYRARLVEKAGGGKIPNEEDDELLAQLRSALQLSGDDVEATHIKECAQSYRVSVQELIASSSTGVILDEYWAGLEKLQARLRLPDEVAEEIYLAEARGALRTCATKAFTAMAQATQKEKEAGREGGDQAKLNAQTRAILVAEASNILEFTKGARLVVDVPNVGPITKVNLKGQIDSRALYEFYKAFLAECFRGEGEQSDALFAQAPLLAQVLGLSAGEVESAQLGLGTTLYKNAIISALKEGGTLSDDDRAFLLTIQQSLKMDAALCESLLVEMKVLRVRTLVDRMFDSSNISAQNTAAIRENCEALGLELGSKQVGLQQPTLLRMLRCEMEAVIEKGEAPADDTSRLGELQESYGLAQSAVTAELESLIAKRCGGHLLQAASALRRNEPDEVLPELEQLIHFNALNPFAVPSQSVGRDERSELLMRYQSSCLTKGPLDDNDRTRIDALRTALGLSDAQLAAGAATPLTRPAAAPTGSPTSPNVL
ncbi:hypothetical protein KFE25_008840 [Diacronema lutheri]|uniref:Uncharacterized protein n=1 Tax=Diacronema lutheri TaxID=2081491 RepID=A0A8J5Y3E6_DIALT|nr:hypothetical protein KFE25_008840 [Diacronema lutheri]